ncbi:MAG: hypothetical protein GY841_13495 [FCB group bacterium]|nr:hypothetical protein [FCB group bacterium]
MKKTKQITAIMIAAILAIIIWVSDYSSPAAAGDINAPNIPSETEGTIQTISPTLHPLGRALTIDNGSNAESSNPMAPCYTQAYNNAPFYSWPMPFGTYNIDEYAVRFSTCEAETLTSVEFVVFDPQDDSFGDDGIVVTVYDDDCGEVGDILITGYLAPHSYTADAWTKVDLGPIVIRGDFYVGLSIPETGLETLVSDDGFSGTGRSMYYSNGTWYTFLNGLSLDVNLLLRANLCEECGSIDRSVSSLIPHIDQSESPWVLGEGAIHSRQATFRTWNKFHRTIRVKRLRCQVEGDFPGNLAEATLEYLVNPSYIAGVEWTDYDHPGLFDLRRSKPKCDQDPCTDGADDGCRWKYLNNCVILEDDPPSELCLEEPVNVNLRVTDMDFNWLKYVLIFLILIVAVLLALVLATWAIVTGDLTPLYGLIYFMVYAAGAHGASYAFLTSDMITGIPDWTHPKTIGEYDGPAISIPAVEGTYCRSLELKNTIRDKPAFVELEVTVTNLGPNPSWQIDDPCNGSKIIDRAPSPESLYFVSFGGASEKEMQIILNVLTDIPAKSLLNPDHFKTYLASSRKFAVYIDTNNCITDGCQGPDCCGAEYKVEFVQTLLGSTPDTVKTDVTTYKWGTDCCVSPVPPEGWIPLSEKPYDILPAHDYLYATIKAESIGDPAEFMFWAVSYRDDVMQDILPADACEQRTSFVRTPVHICPEVVGYNISKLAVGQIDQPVYVYFSEAMKDIVPSDVDINPSVPVSLALDETSNILIISPVTQWSPGEYTVTLHPTIQDLSGNLLNGDREIIGCGEPYSFDFCVEDTLFFPSGSDGVREEIFDTGEHIYANSSGGNFPPNTNFDIYLILHRDVEVGLELYDLTNTGPTNLTSSATGAFNLIDLGTIVFPCEVSAIADLDNDTIYDSTDIVMGLCAGGILAGRSCIDGLDGIVGWWTGEETSNSSQTIDFAEANHGRLSGGVNSVTGMVGQAWEFDGIDDYIEVPDAPEHNFGEAMGLDTSDFTIELWMMTADVTGVNILWDKRIVTTYAQGWSLFTSGGVLGFQLADGVGSPICSNNTGTSSCTNYTSGVIVATGAWRHVAVSVDRDGLGKFYVDGQEVADFDASIREGSLITTNPMRFGCSSNSPPFSFYIGKIDDPAIYDRVLTASEIDAIYSAGSMGKCCTDETDVRCDCFLAGGCDDNCCDEAGDANNDGPVNVGDAVYMINYVFKGGPEPECKAEGDANGDCTLNVGDAVYLINYVFKGGDSPICNNECVWD